MSTVADLPIVSIDTDEFRDDSVRILAEACAAGPICRIGPQGFLGVLRFRDVDAVLRDPRTFSSRVELLPQPAGTARLSVLIGDDPPDHTRLRALLGQVFTPARLTTTMEPRVLAIARELVERVVEAGRSFDLVRDLAAPFPVRVISELLGVDAGDLPRFKRWSDDVVAAAFTAASPDGPEKQQRLARIEQSLRELDAYLLDAIAEHRRRPREDLISFMLDAAEGSDRLTPDEVTGTAKLLLVAGNETTTRLLGLATNLILRTPGAWEELGETPALVPGMVEEAARLEGPIVKRTRKALRATVVAGTEVAAGELVDAVIAAANLDPTVFPDPTRFDLRRQIPRHLAFGTGIHQCLGAPLARLEARLLFEELLDHMETLAPDGPAVRSPPTGARGFASMPLRFRPPRRSSTRSARQVERDVAVAGELAARSDASLGLDRRSRETVRVARVRDLAEGIKLFRLVHPTGGLLTRFTAGSHLVVHLQDGDRRWRNAYSLLNSEFGNGLNYFVAVSLEEGGRGGSRFLHERVRPGDELEVSVPANHFPPAPDAARHLLVAGGIGITPLFAIRNHLRALGEPTELHYTFRAARRAAFVEELELEADPTARLYDNALGQHLDVDAVVRAQPPGTHVYTCGPEGLMDAVIESALRHGWDRRRIHFERFGADRPHDEVPFEVECRRSGRTFVCGGDETLLDALERAGLELPYACRAGNCGACACDVLAGEVEHHDTVLSDAEKDGGRMLPCVSRGRTRVVLDL